MKRIGLALIVAVALFGVTASTALAGPCGKTLSCGPPPFPPGHDEGSPSPVRVSPGNNIVIDVTGAGITISNTAFDGILIDITGAGILIDITGAGLANRFRIR